MDHSQVTTKIWKDTHRKLRLLAALTEESIVTLIDRLVDEEMKRVRTEGGDEEMGSSAMERFLRKQDENGEE